MIFRHFPCEKKDETGACNCRVCKSHPLPLWDEKRVDEDYHASFHSYRTKAAPSDFLQPVLVIHVRKKYWDKIPPFVLDPTDPTHLRFDYPLFPIFNNVGINENQRRAAMSSPVNFLMQNRVNTDAAAVFTVCVFVIVTCFLNVTQLLFWHCHFLLLAVSCSGHYWRCRTQLQGAFPCFLRSNRFIRQRCSRHACSFFFVSAFELSQVVGRCA
jgi:hypothetical protein